jgi:hypothetical protein
MLLVGGCAPDPQAVCVTFVDAWTDYLERCGRYGGTFEEVVPERVTPATVERDLFGEAGCGGAAHGDFRDPSALLQQCIPMLDELACETSTLPEPCRDQLLAPEP